MWSRDNRRVIRMPCPALRPFVRQLWVGTTPLADAPGREHVLPSGDMHLVVRPAGEPVRLFGDGNRPGVDIGSSVVGGIRTAFYAKEVPSQVQSVGVTFHPVAAYALFGCPADELTGRHTSLQELWGRLHGEPAPGEFFKTGPPPPARVSG
jgi:hypothetical protein